VLVQSALILFWTRLGSLPALEHESPARYGRPCSGCLQRTVHWESGDRVHFYHPQLTLLLGSEKFHLLLDLEPPRPAEDEVTTALRLLARLLAA
jgi:hypothetical protein